MTSYKETIVKVGLRGVVNHEFVLFFVVEYFVGGEDKISDDR